MRAVRCQISFEGDGVKYALQKGDELPKSILGQGAKREEEKAYAMPRAKFKQNLREEKRERIPLSEHKGETAMESELVSQKTASWRA